MGSLRGVATRASEPPRRMRRAVASRRAVDRSLFSGRVGVGWRVPRRGCRDRRRCLAPLESVRAGGVSSRTNEQSLVVGRPEWSGVREWRRRGTGAAGPGVCGRLGRSPVSTTRFLARQDPWRQGRRTLRPPGRAAPGTRRRNARTERNGGRTIASVCGRIIVRLTPERVSGFAKGAERAQALRHTLTVGQAKTVEAPRASPASELLPSEVGQRRPLLVSGCRAPCKTLRNCTVSAAMR